VRAVDGYVPIEIKLHLLTNPGGQTLESSPLSSPFPTASHGVPGKRFRRGSPWTKDSLQLAHYHRMLEAHGYAATHDGILGGVIDGSGALWWINIDSTRPTDGLGILDAYDRRFHERIAIVDTTIARNRDRTLSRARSPWWHKDCETCPYGEICHEELEAADDVSLIHWSSPEMLELLRSQGVATRRDLAGLDLTLVDLGDRLADTTLPFARLLDLANHADPATAINDVVGERMGVRKRLAVAGIEVAGDITAREARTLGLAGKVNDLGRLVRRARAAIGGGILLRVPPEALDSSRADVEIDVDMESYGNATYLWGALVTLRKPVEGVEEGYRAFVTFDDLNDAREAGIFLDFWNWLMATRSAVRAQGATFRSYCFWRAAEEGQMRRALTLGAPDSPTERILERFFASDEWVDLHELARDQFVTEGPLGLKALATRAGFSWRDEDPSGEASIGWYEEAIGENPEPSRERLLAYNEDDVRATRALRDWFDGPARRLPRVEEMAQ
jgi:predicted RecB family nuclease